MRIYMHQGQADYLGAGLRRLQWKTAGFVFLILLGTSGCGATFRFKPTAVFVGDSITANWVADWAGQQPTFVANKWLDVGVVGLTSSEIVPQFTSYVLGLQPPVVHILAGTNDVYPGWQLSETANNIRQMVTRAKRDHIGVVLGTIPPWGPGALTRKADPSPERFQRIAQLNQWLLQYAAEQGVQIVDYHALLAAPDGESYVPALTVDGVHPNAAGYAVMEPSTEKAIQAALATR